MHADELHTDAALARRLLAEQFPDWAGLPIERVPSSGTDNALYRLGDDMVVRLPRRPSGSSSIDHEYEWTQRLGRYLPVAIPEALAMGAPSHGYPASWAVYGWLEGANPEAGNAAEPVALGISLV